MENKIPVVVLTEFKEIFFGYCEDFTSERLHLHDVRQALYFSVGSGGLVGLGAHGPSEKSRITHVADEMIVSRPVNVVKCTDKSEKMWVNITGWRK